MRIAVVGAGGVGGIVAGLLARAGVDVALLARGAQLEVIRARGLSVESPLGSFTVRIPAVSDNAAALGPADAVLVSVKSWQVAGIAPSLAPLLARAGVAVPLQNGVEAAPRLAGGLGDERVAGGIIHVLAWIDSPGSVKHVGMVPRITMGERGPQAGKPSPRLEALAAALRHAGMEAAVAADVEAATWEKFLLIEPWGTVSAAARAPIGVVRRVPEARALLAAAMEEVAALARARGVALPHDAVAKVLRIVDGVPAEATASMQRDIGAGRPSELDDQPGTVVRLAREAGVPVPVHSALYAALLPQDGAAHGAIPRFART
jgi:2-dehydropantoate 2-reductase